ncbi:globin domain-containing protein [Pseudophaeobacter sp.]|uniref:globin domain-containing protein n=1 Tax=Pseudophaeobacter sp. TaxID=1971739 RepID=UPI004058FFEB
MSETIDRFGTEGDGMETRDIEELQSSFSTVFARKGELTEQFYCHLFTMMPEAKSLFKNDFHKQKEMFTSMLTNCLKTMVSNQNLSHVKDTLTKTREQFNIGPDEAGLAGEAMMAALEDVVGGDLSPAQKAAWKKAVDRVMQMMVTPGLLR